MEHIRDRDRVRGHVPRDAPHQAQRAGAVQHGGKLPSRADYQRAAGNQKVEESAEPADAMATAEKQAYAGANGPAFVAAKKAPSDEAATADAPPAQVGNSDEIEISDDEL